MTEHKKTNKFTEWKDSELAKTYEEMKIRWDRLDFLEKQIGKLPEGMHPDEINPRAETWLQERLNWQSEVKLLNEQIKEQQLIIYGLEEGISQWEGKCSDLQFELDKKEKYIQYLNNLDIR